ncbi:hypothetical protein BC943DRAFT_376840 [Umbelopsis sp. AD052]|nr:hypothetical protein BC943DRAFT_376840 [Umbelopsis sp. AD052]
MSSPTNSRGHSFAWPPNHHAPSIPSAHANYADISIKEILDKYRDDKELMKHVLAAKAEEDKKRAAEETLRVEQARIQLKYLDLELAREQSRQHRTEPTLAPLQQQLLARITGKESENYATPSSMHPSPTILPPIQQHLSPHSIPTAQQQQLSPISPETSSPRKRSRANHFDTHGVNRPTPSHDQVMEALKAKIQKGRQLNRANSLHDSRSNKPFLPPINTTFAKHIPPQQNSAPVLSRPNPAFSPALSSSDSSSSGSDIKHEPTD